MVKYHLINLLIGFQIINNTVMLKLFDIIACDNLNSFEDLDDIIGG